MKTLGKPPYTFISRKAKVTRDNRAMGTWSDAVTEHSWHRALWATGKSTDGRFIPTPSLRTKVKQAGWQPLSVQSDRKP